MIVSVPTLTSPPGLNELKRRLRSWLTCSAANSDGAFVGWIDRKTGRPSFEYPEITGYALTFLAGLDDLTDEEHALGCRAARWLLERLAYGRTAPHERYGVGLEYSFDLAMISTGLQRFGAVISDDELVATGRVVAGRLAGEVAAHGWLEPLTRSSRNTGRSAWSTRGHAHLLKATQCLLLADRGGVAGSRDAADAIVTRGVADLQADGRFRTDPDASTTMVHPHLYAVEGLWIYARGTGDSVADACARSAMAWAWSQQTQSGGFPRWVAERRSDKESIAPEQGDVTAQAVRAAALMGIRGANVGQAVLWLGRSAVQVSEGCAIAYQPTTPPAHLNAWATMSAHQALDALSGRELKWDELV